MSSFLPLAEISVKFAAGLGISRILAGIIKNNVVIETTTQKVLVATGSTVLGSMLVEQSSNHIERQIAEIRTRYEEMQSKKEQTEEKKTEE